MLGKQELIYKIQEIYGDYYDYSLVTDISNRKTDKIPLICPKHGIFYKTYDKLINVKQGCQECSCRKRRTTQEFIDKIQNNFKNTEYTFEKTKYVSYKYPLIITCHHKNENNKEHGDFKIMPSHALNGQGCPKCRYIKSSQSNKLTLNDIIKKANKIHLRKYDYSLIKEYIGIKRKYKIICSVHGIFEQTLSNHIYKKQGCPKCAIIKNANKKKNSFEDFVLKANAIHNNKYTYIKETYNGLNNYITIICPIHGVFKMKANNHLYLRQNCPKCSYTHSMGENELYDWLCQDISNNLIERHNRTILNGEELDIYIPSKKIAIEYNGLYWHSNLCKKDKNYHLNKTLKCEEQGIRLIHIFEDEWLYKKETVKNYLKNQLSDIIISNNLVIQELDYNNAKKWLSNICLHEFSSDNNFIIIKHNNIFKICVVFSYNKNTNSAKIIDMCCNDCIVSNNILKYIENYLSYNFNIQFLEIILDRRLNNSIFLFKNNGYIYSGNTNPKIYNIESSSKFQVYDCGYIYLYKSLLK